MRVTVSDLITALLRAYPADMQRLDDDGEKRRDCYSVAYLTEMLGAETANHIAQANEGVPIWTQSLRNYLAGAVRT